jgi:CRP/FNR family transcriptional regulator
MEKINLLAHKHMHGKLADTFLYLADEVYNNDTFETPLSRQDLADMSAMTKESAIRVMKEFKDEGIMNYNTTHFEILNKESLKKISQTG